MQRLKSRAQFEAAMAGGTVSRTAHFVLHRAVFPEPNTVVPAEAGTQGVGGSPDALDSRLRGNDGDALDSRLRGNDGGASGSRLRGNDLFGIRNEPWIGVVLPKRWAKRAVTRNGIKRQVYNVSELFATRLPAAAHVVRLRSEFARARFPSAWSDALKASVRGELLKLFEQARP